jgi:hypothetical protein
MGERATAVSGGSGNADGESPTQCRGFPVTYIMPCCCFITAAIMSLCYPLEAGDYLSVPPFSAVAIAFAPTVSSKLTFTSSPVLMRPNIIVGGLMP